MSADPRLKIAALGECAGTYVPPLDNAEKFRSFIPAGIGKG
jgi:hypothetical protein